MKKLIILLGLLVYGISLSAMDWSEYETLCFINNVEPSYEEWEWLSNEGATDYGYDNLDLEIFLIEEDCGN